MDSDSDDDNVHFGTPLEPLEEGSAAKRRPPALEDQTVRDSRGRQRFHGAFTGGFSAGFFNTVGSKDGFQPATFVSSRNTRADRRQARPDDFMDEEDRGEHGIAPQRLQLTAEFRETPSGGIKRKHPQYDEGPIPGEPVLSQLVKPVRDTVGVRILKSMGWRPGQGIGPRVSRKEKKRQRKVYGCARPPGADEPAAAPSGSDSDSDSDSALRELLLAPDDYETPLVKPKHDQMGLGYRGLDRRSVLGPTSADATLRYRDKAGKVAIRGQAFGVGAFEEEDDDIYGTEDMSNYDFESAPERPTARPAPSPADRLARTLAGFRLAESARSTRARYPPPPLPADFVPRHKARASRFEPLPEERRGLERHRLSAGQRADMIGEQRPAVEVVAGSASGAQSAERVTVAGSTPALARTPTPAATASAALGAQTRSEPSPTAPATPAAVPPPGPSHPPAAATQIKTEPGVPPPPRTEESERLREVHRVLAESTDSPAVPALKPFARDPEKQARYEQFLKLSAANRKDDYRLLLPASMTDWEREREISEFHRSALIFRPLAASLASKFVSAGTTEQERPLEAEGSRQRKDADDPATQAARRKMFGMLTRQTQEWHPAPLLCRRFNVKNPFPHSSVVGTLGPTSGAATSASISSELVLRPPSPEEHTPPAAPAPKPRLRWDDAMRPDSAGSGAAMGSGATADGGGGSTAPRTTLALPPPSVVGVQPAAAPAQKPPADLFKAIFDDSDTESESEEAAQAERADSPGTPPPPVTSLAVTASVTASQSPVTRDVTPDIKPAVTSSVTDRSRAGVTTPDTTVGTPAPLGSTPALQESGGQSGKSGGPASRPSAASFFEQPPTAAAKRPGFSLFDNVDLDELNSWRRGSGSRGDGDGGSEKKLDTSSASAPAGTGVRGDSPSSDEYGPRLPPAGASASSLSAVSRIGRDKDRSDNDSSRWRERSLSKEKKKKKSKKHKKSDKKKKKRKDNVSDSDSSDSDVDMNLFKKLRDVITGKKKKKKKSSSKH